MGSFGTLALKRMPISSHTRNTIRRRAACSIMHYCFIALHCIRRTNAPHRERELQWRMHFSFHFISFPHNKIFRVQEVIQRGNNEEEKADEEGEEGVGEGEMA